VPIIPQFLKIPLNSRPIPLALKMRNHIPLAKLNTLIDLLQHPLLTCVGRIASRHYVPLIRYNNRLTGLITRLCISTNALCSSSAIRTPTFLFR
jgi:hypothetical protein